VPKVRAGVIKHWWNEGLTELKQASIDAHDFWVAWGRPKQGEIFRLMKRALFVQQQANISTDTERRAGALAIAELLVALYVLVN